MLIPFIGFWLCLHLLLDLLRPLDWWAYGKYANIIQISLIFYQIAWFITLKLVTDQITPIIIEL